ncbi:MAG: hypothetical protein ORN28_01405, partial [Rhodoferax sp.]|nr:hypothetical protein [Rhodoferax sp.]
MVLKNIPSKTTQPTEFGPDLDRVVTATATLPPGMAAAPLDAEKTAIQRVRNKQSPKKPGKPQPDAQQDSSATEDGKAAGISPFSQNSDSAQASDEGMARSSLTDSVLSSPTSSAAELAISEGSLPTSSLSASVLDSIKLDSNSPHAASSNAPSVLLAQAKDTANNPIATDGTHATNLLGTPDAVATTTTSSTNTTNPTNSATSASQAGFGWGIWAGAGAAAVGALALGGSKSSDATPTPTPTPTQPISAVHIQSIGLGPLITDDAAKPFNLTAIVYEANGTKVIGRGTVGPDGQARFTLDYAYSGAAIVKISGTAHYRDEATGQPKQFASADSGPMLATLILSASQASTVTVNVNTLTTFAANEAGVTIDQSNGSIGFSKPFNPESVKAASNQVAGLIGLTGDNVGDRLTQITPVFAVDSGFNSADLPNSDGVKVGTFLAIVSGLEKSQSTPTKEFTTKEVIQQLNASFDSTNDVRSIAPLLLQGAGQVSVLGSSVSSYLYAQLKVNSVGIHSNKTQLKVGESATITFTFGGDPGS